jgi:acyl-coenzyme A thioesterase PaaI-like protein
MKADDVQREKALGRLHGAVVAAALNGATAAQIRQEVRAGLAEAKALKR